MRLLIAFVLFITSSYAAQTCSRTAIIGDQHVLVDLNSSQKGEGLRHYLQKEPLSLTCLERYRKAQELNIMNATLGSIGATSTILGLALDTSKSTKNLMISAGLATLLVNYLVAKTRQISNEKNFRQAIDIYNQRQMPRIKLLDEDRKDFKDGVSIQFQKEF